jgi:hypothetical protein
VNPISYLPKFFKISYLRCVANSLPGVRTLINAGVVNGDDVDDDGERDDPPEAPETPPDEPPPPPVQEPPPQHGTKGPYVVTAESSLFTEAKGEYWRA